jgi:hypothetical protein
MVALVSRFESMKTSLTDRQSLAADAVLLWSFALAVQLLYLSWNYPAFWDELYHLLAARSWLADGTFRIAEGTYDRSPIITVATGVVTGLLGDGLFAGRLFPAFVGSLWVLAVFIWTRAVAGRAAGWIAACLMGLSPVILETSGFVRFYSLHGLAFWLGAVATFAAMTSAAFRPMILWAAAAVAMLKVALELQDITYIGMVALALWAGFTFVSGGQQSRRRWRMLGLGALGLIVATLLVTTGALENLIGRYTWIPGWAAETTDRATAYHHLFRGSYPTLYTLLPIAALIAIARVPHVGSFAVVVFVTCFVLLSIAPAKADRYIAFTIPFFCVVWGIAISELMPALRKLAVRAMTSYSDRVGGIPYQPVAAAAALGVALLFVVATNPAFSQTLSLLAGKKPDGGIWATDASWKAAAGTLRDLIETADVVVTPNSLHALYYVGTYDFEYRRTGVYETLTGQEFGIDPRTGRRVIATAASLERLMACYPTGLVFSEAARWRHVTGIDVEAADLLAAAATEVELPARWRIRAFRWETQPDGRHPVGCAFLDDHAPAISTTASQ